MIFRLRQALCAVFALIWALVPVGQALAQHEDAPEGSPTWESQWDALADPEFNYEVVQRDGWFFGGALGAVYLANTTATDGNDLGSGGYTGNGQIGAYLIEDRLALSFLLHGMVGPRRGDAAFSVFNYLGRADLWVWDINNANHVYLIGGAGYSDIGTLPVQAVPGGGADDGGFEVTAIYGAGITLKRFAYIQTSVEYMGLQVLSGNDKFHALGINFRAWFVTDTGLFE